MKQLTKFLLRQWDVSLSGVLRFNKIKLSKTFCTNLAKSVHFRWPYQWTIIYYLIILHQYLADYLFNLIRTFYSGKWMIHSDRQHKIKLPFIYCVYSVPNTKTIRLLNIKGFLNENEYLDEKWKSQVLSHTICLL